MRSVNATHGKKGFQPVVGELRRSTTVQLTASALDELARHADVEGISRNLEMERLIREAYQLPPVAHVDHDGAARDD